ncbi:MAG: hypothetical protein ACOYOB_21675, partial [Myxococcota bacterium]
MTDLTKASLSPEQCEEMKKRIPMGRFAQPGDVQIQRPSQRDALASGHRLQCRVGGRAFSHRRGPVLLDHSDPCRGNQVHAALQVNAHAGPRLFERQRLQPQSGQVFRASLEPPLQLACGPLRHGVLHQFSHLAVARDVQVAQTVRPRATHGERLFQAPQLGVQRSRVRPQLVRRHPYVRGHAGCPQRSVDFDLHAGQIHLHARLLDAHAADIQHDPVRTLGAHLRPRVAPQQRRSTGQRARGRHLRGQLARVQAHRIPHIGRQQPQQSGQRACVGRRGVVQRISLSRRHFHVEGQVGTAGRRQLAACFDLARGRLVPRPRHHVVAGSARPPTDPRRRNCASHLQFLIQTDAFALQPQRCLRKADWQPRLSRPQLPNLHRRVLLHGPQLPARRLDLTLAAHREPQPSPLGQRAQVRWKGQRRQQLAQGLTGSIHLPVQPIGCAVQTRFALTATCLQSRPQQRGRLTRSTRIHMELLDFRPSAQA